MSTRFWFVRAGERAADTINSGSEGYESSRKGHFRPFDTTRFLEPFVASDHGELELDTLALKEKASRDHLELLNRLYDVLKTNGWQALEEDGRGVDLRGVSPSKS